MNEITHLRKELEEALINFLWDQWVSLGIGAPIQVQRAHFVIDPEALVLATTRWGSLEPRLQEQSIDWLLNHGKMISTQRLKTIRDLFQFARPQALDDLAEFLPNHGQPSWRALSNSDPSLEENAQPFVKADFNHRNLSQAPDPSLPENFILKMRYVFGINARPDIITWLMTHSHGHPAQIADDIRWSPKSVLPILRSFEKAGLVVSTENGRTTIFKRSSKEALFSQCYSHDLLWLDQAYLYRLIRHLHDLISRIEENKERSDPWKAIQIREHLTAMNIAGHHLGEPTLFSACLQERGKEMVETFFSDAAKIVDFMSTRKPLA